MSGMAREKRILLSIYIMPIHLWTAEWLGLDLH